jgi:hypothetical protein
VKLKIVRRSQILINIVIFMIFSFLFIHGQIALYQEVSAIKFSLFKINLKSLYYIAGLLIITSLGVLRLKTWAKYTFFLSVLVVIFFTIRIQLYDMSKISMLLLFFYVIASYYFYNFLGEELNEPCYVPAYRDDELFDPMLKKLNCQVSIGNKLHDGYLTNWNDHSCFIKFKEKAPIIPKKVQFKTNFQGRVFECEGTVVSKASNQEGIGLYFYIRDDEGLAFGWRDFYQVLNEYGLQSELLK